MLPCTGSTRKNGLDPVRHAAHLEALVCQGYLALPCIRANRDDGHKCHLTANLCVINTTHEYGKIGAASYFRRYDHA